jgi:hypothetical protein
MGNRVNLGRRTGLGGERETYIVSTLSSSSFSLSRLESSHRSIWFLGNFKIGVSGLYMVECGNLGNLSRNDDLSGI